MATTATAVPARLGMRAAPVETCAPGDAPPDLLAAVPNFKEWIYNTIRPHLHGLILEVGSGDNSFSQRLLDDGHEVYLADSRLRHCHRLRRQFALLSHCRGVLPMELGDAGFDTAYPHLVGQFGAVIAFNVLERIADDRRAVANAFKLLRPGGHLIVLAPANPLLFGRADRERGGLRRYTRRRLRQVFGANDLDTVRSMYLNLAGVLGWWVPGLLPHNGPPTSRQVQWWNRMVPFTRRLDRLLLRCAGLSVLAVGRKGEASRLAK